MGQVKLPLVKRITCVLCTGTKKLNSGGVSSSLWSYDTVCAWCCGSHQRSGYEHSQLAQQKNHQCVRDASFSSSLETKVGVPPSSFMWGPRHVLGKDCHVAMWRGETVCTLSMQKTCQDGLCCWHCIWHPQRPLHADRSCQPFLMFMPDWSHQSHLLLWIFSLFAVLIQDVLALD